MNDLFVDKSIFIKEWLQQSASVSLITRPRRFGKSTNLNLIKIFFDISSNINEQSLFNQMEIFKHEEFCKLHFMKYPIIYLDMKSLKMEDYESFIKGFSMLLRGNLQKLILNYELDEFSVNEIKAGLDINDINTITNYLKSITRILFTKFKKQCIILIDEYESAIQHSFEKDEKFYKQTLALFQGFYGNSFKENDYLLKSCLTGILNVAGLSLFSGFNNFSSYTVLDNLFNDKFGFTKHEVIAILKNYKDKNIDLEEINFKLLETYYNGYIFGTKSESCPIFNPWSVLSALHKKRVINYWYSTGSKTHLKLLFNKSKVDDLAFLKQLFETYSFDDEANYSNNKNYVCINLLEDNIINYESENLTENQFYLLLLNAGYLTITKEQELNKNYVKCCLPNHEIFQSFKILFNELLQNRINISYSSSSNLITDLKQLKLMDFKQKFEDLFLNSISYHDITNKENSYHCIVFGIILALHETRSDKFRSNRESGLGRYDIKLKTSSGNIVFIFEFKCNENEKVGVKDAMNQIELRKYQCEEFNKTDNIVLIAMCFNKKITLVNYKLFKKSTNSNEYVLFEKFISE
jgi:hypothetical protein